ncbi:BON domain-containing protein [Dokdonella sp.]|uniref:BON domain-containing protein n=1 Tax=Dokdonella sp. TaxID=2291710 RepID=UPI001B19D672|nr:BON domain-containing protein [Dokdonella sp.]MBO9662881.1 BON domain-containing protein [Dokdonella sp.]
MKTTHRFAASFAFCGLLTIAAAAAPVVALAADEHADDQKSDQPVSDTWITTKVKSQLATTDGVKSMDISVKTVNGVVMLSGTQPDQTAIKNAVAAAQQIKGVKSVDASALTVHKDMDGGRPQ